MQGLVLDKIVVDMKATRFSPGQPHVTYFSWENKLNGLYIVNFNEKAIKATKDVKDEMKRRNENLLSPLPIYNCSHNYITFALLNVWSLNADIECDDSLACAIILCFTETWLT